GPAARPSSRPFPSKGGCSFGRPAPRLFGCSYSIIKIILFFRWTGGKKKRRVGGTDRIRKTSKPATRRFPPGGPPEGPANLGPPTPQAVPGLGPPSLRNYLGRHVNRPGRQASHQGACNDPPDPGAPRPSRGPTLNVERFITRKRVFRDETAHPSARHEPRI